MEAPVSRFHCGGGGAVANCETRSVPSRDRPAATDGAENARRQYLGDIALDLSVLL